MKTKTETYRLPIAYTCTTPESSEYGEPSDMGWQDETGSAYDTLEELADAMRDHGPLEYSGNWWRTVDPDQDFETGEDTTLEFFPERDGVRFEDWPIGLADRFHDLLEGR